MMYSRGFSFTPIVVFLIAALLIAVFLGTAIVDTDFLNSATNQAKARQIDAETAYQQQLWALELEAKEAQQAKKLELMERDAQLKAEMFELAVMVILGVAIAIGGAVVFRLLCASLAPLLRQPKQPADEVAQEGRGVIPFPGLPPRARVLTTSPATALVLLVLGVAVLTVSISLL